MLESQIRLGRGSSHMLVRIYRLPRNVQRILAMRCTSKSYGSVQKEGNQRKLERTILLITSIYLKKTHNDQQHMKHSHVGSHVNKYTFLRNNTNT